MQNIDKIVIFVEESANFVKLESTAKLCRTLEKQTDLAVTIRVLGHRRLWQYKSWRNGGTHRYGAYDLGSGQLTSLMVFGGLVFLSGKVSNFKIPSRSQRGAARITRTMLGRIIMRHASAWGDCGPLVAAGAPAPARPPVRPCSLS